MPSTLRWLELDIDGSLLFMPIDWDQIVAVIHVRGAFPDVEQGIHLFRRSDDETSREVVYIGYMPDGAQSYSTTCSYVRDSEDRWLEGRAARQGEGHRSELEAFVDPSAATSIEMIRSNDHREPTFPWVLNFDGMATGTPFQSSVYIPLAGKPTRVREMIMDSQEA